MARALGNPTPALPYFATWAAALNEIEETGANAPVILGWTGQPRLSIVVASDIAACAPEWHVIVEEPKLRATLGTLIASDDSVVGVIPAVTSPTPTSRRMGAQNDNGFFVHVPVQFDLAALRQGPSINMYLAVANMGGAGAVYLIDYKFSDVPL